MAGKAVVKAAFALIAKAFARAATGVTPLAVGKTTATIATKTAFTRTGKAAARAARIASTTAVARGETGARCFRNALLGLQTCNHVGLDGLAGIRLDIKNFATIAQLGKGNGQAIAPGPACAADAVGVVLGLHRQTVVKHVGDGGHVNTARCNVGGDQNLHMALAQRHQAAVAQALAEGAVQGNGVKAVLLQIVG